MPEFRGGLPGPFIGFQLKHIGDFLMTLPALGLIKKHRPAEKTALALSPGVAGLARNHPWVDQVIVLDREAGPGRFFQALRKIRRENFGTAFIFDGQSPSILSARLAGIANRVGSPRLSSLKWPSLYTMKVTEGFSPLDSQALRGQKMVAGALGLPLEPALRPVAPPMEPADLQAIAPLLAELRGAGPRIGLTLQGRQYEKSWPLSHFAELCRRLWQTCQARLFVTGGPAEAPLATALAEAAGVPVANFCGRSTLGQLLALARASDLFVTVDTGTSHVAALTETPLISIFIWTNPAQWPPQSPQAHLLCYDWALARFGLTAADGPWQTAPVVTPDMVLAKIQEILR